MAGKRPKDWRAGIRSFQVESPTKQYLHAIGSNAGQPQGRARRLGSRLLLVAAVRGAGPCGVAALPSGWAGLPGRLLCPGGRRPVGPECQEELESGEGGFSGDDLEKLRLLFAFLIENLKYALRLLQ